jgi:hypothetical protein
MRRRYVSIEVLDSALTANIVFCQAIFIDKEDSKKAKEEIHQ